MTATSLTTPDIEAVVEATLAVGLVTQVAQPSEDADLVVVTPAGRRHPFELKRLALASSDIRSRLDSGQTTRPPRPGLVVADRITAEGRAELTKGGWSWLDLRGHLHLTGDGIYVDADVPTLRREPPEVAPLEGRVAMEVATALLLEPEAPAAVRALAAQLGRAPSSVSQALSRMSAAGLVDELRRPAVPELFWAVADRWRPAEGYVRSLPAGRGAADDMSVALRFQRDGSGVGWALTDNLAANAYRAPVAVRSDHPPELYVPDETILRRSVRLLGSVPDASERAATLRVAPVLAVCSQRVRWPGEFWPLTRPLFVALDLARDPGRGREILQGWNPREAGHRVW